MRRLLIYYDPNDVRPLGECACCGGEIYSEEEGEVCHECRKKMSRWDQKTVAAVMEEMDFQLQKYLSDDLRNAVWNAVAEEFSMEGF